MQIQMRYIVSAIITLATVVSYLTRANLNMAIVSMVDQERLKDQQTNDSVTIRHADACPAPEDEDQPLVSKLLVHNNNETTDSSPAVKVKQYAWDQSTQGWILGAFFYTYILIQLPAGILAEKFGGRWVILTCIAGSAIVSLITPLITDFPVAVLITARLVLGCCQAGCFPSVFGLFCAWMPLKERSTAFGLLNTGAKIGGCLPYFLSGILISSYGWPALFYVPGIVALVILIVFFVMVRSTPEDHPFISEREVRFIQQANESEGGKKAEKTHIPWLRIVTNASVLSVAFFQFACFWVLTIFFSYIPKYLNEIIHVPVGMNGMINGIVYLISLTSLLTTGFLSEMVIQKGILTRTNTRRAFSLVTGTATSVCFFLIPAVGCNRPALYTLIFVGSVLTGFSSGSDTPLASEMSKNFPSALFALLNMTATSTGFIVPAVCGSILQSLHDDPWKAWSIIFYIAGAVNIFANIVFIIFVRAERQDFDLIDDPVIPKHEDNNNRTASHNHGHEITFNHIHAKDQVIELSYKNENPIDVADD